MTKEQIINQIGKDEFNFLRKSQTAIIQNYIDHAMDYVEAGLVYKEVGINNKLAYQAILKLVKKEIEKFKKNLNIN